MDIINIIYSLNPLDYIILFLIWFLGTCFFAMIMKHFIREAIKEALKESGLNKRETDKTW